VQLRDARLVHAQLGADLLHRHLAVVVERDHALLPGRERGHGALHPLLHLALLVDRIGPLRFGWHQHGGQLLVVHLLGRRVGRRGFNRVDADDGPAKPLLVGADGGGEVRQRRLVPELGPELLPCGLQLATHTPDAARPGVLSQGVDHGTANATLGKGLELDPAAAVEPLGGVDEPDHAVLDEVSQVNRMRHRRRHSPGKGFDERQSGFHAVGCGGIDTHSFAHPPDPGSGPAAL